MDTEMERQQEAASELRTIARTQCGGCKRYFVSVTVFDQHRAGSFDKQTRRCLTDEELRTAGMDTERRNVRMMRENRTSFEPHDVWYDVAGRERLRRAFAKDAPE